MKSEYVLEKKGNFLCFTISGEYDKNEFMTYPKLVAEICETEKTQHVLFNALKLRGTNLPAMDRFFLGESVAKILGPLIKLAVVWPGEHITKFGENVAANRGSHILVVGDVETAREWLLRES